MPIVECKDCKTMVSTSAEICPKCGAKYPASYIPSKVSVHRTTNIVGFAVRLIVYADEEKKGELWRDESVDFMLPYGDHKIKVKGKALGGTSAQISIRILPAKIYRIEVDTPFSGIKFETYIADA